MSDRLKAGAEKREMSRDQLVRANFDAYADLEWVKNLEPKFRQYHLDAGELQHYRAAWNAHTEKRDWEWWQDHVKGWSNEKLMAEIDECMQEIKAIEMRQGTLDRADTAGRSLKEILNSAAVQPSAEPARTPTHHKGRDGQ